MYSPMLTPALRALSKNGKSSHFWNGSVQVMPFVLHQCTGGAAAFTLAAGGRDVAPAGIDVVTTAIKTPTAAIPTIRLLVKGLNLVSSHSRLTRTPETTHVPS